MRTYGKPKKPAGRVTYIIRVYDRGTGRRSWVSTQCTTLETAKEWKRSRELEEAMGPERVEAHRTSETIFGDALTGWLEEKKLKVSSGRYTSYKSQAEAFWRPAFGKLRLRDVTTDALKTYSRKRKAGILKVPKGEPARPITTTTANDDLRGLASFFNYCVRSRWLSKSPMLGVEKFAGQIRRRTRMLTPQEEGALLAACTAPRKIKMKAKRNKGGRRGGKVSKSKKKFTITVTPPDYLRPLVHVALNCGFRRRTLCGIEWGHLDLESGQWFIPASLMKVPEDYVAPVPKSVMETLTTYRAQLLEDEGPRRVAPGATIFGLMPGANLRRSFKRAREKAGLPDFSLHDCRRVYLNKLRQAGVGVEAAMALTAHKNLSTVMKFYREVGKDELKRAVAALEGRAAEGVSNAEHA